MLDLFCGAGGAAQGYYRAGFSVHGWDSDVRPLKHYPFPHSAGDALDVLTGRKYLDRFDFIHASPPCQRFTQMNHFGTMGDHPDLITPTRALLIEWGGPYVIENVERAPLINPVTLCGSSFGLGVRRHRLFESNVPLVGSVCDHEAQPAPIPVVGHGAPSSFRKRHGYSPTVAECRLAMHIDWMNRDELAEAIPPAYTEFVGRQLLGNRAAPPMPGVAYPEPIFHDDLPGRVVDGTT